MNPIAYWQQAIILSRQLWRLAREQHRKVISLVLAVLFVFTMTGMDTILAYGFDNNRQDNYDQQNSLLRPANPIDQNQPDAFLPVVSPESLKNDVSTTRLNVLKAEYGDLLSTVSLQTVAEKTLAGVGVETALKWVDVTLPQGEQPAGTQPEEQPAEQPVADPSLLVDVATTSQGPLSLSLNLDSLSGKGRLSETSDLAQLPIPAEMLPKEITAPVQPGTVESEVVAQENVPTTQPVETEVEARTETVTQPEQPVENQLPEVKPVEQPADQGGETQARDTEETDKKSNAETTLADLTKQFLALLGMDDKLKEDTAAKTEETLLPGETATEPETQDTALPADTQAKKDVTETLETGEPQPGVQPEEEEPEGEETVVTEEKEEDGEQPSEDKDNEGDESQVELPEQVLRLLGLGDKEKDTEEGAVAEGPSLEDFFALLGEDREDKGEGGTTEEEVDVNVDALLDELKNGGAEGPDEEEAPNSVLVNLIEQLLVKEKPVVEELPEGEVPVDNTDTVLTEDTEIALVGPEAGMVDEEEPKETDITAPTENEADETGEVVAAGVRTLPDGTQLRQDALLVNVLPGTDAAQPREVNLATELSDAFKRGLSTIVGPDSDLPEALSVPGSQLETAGLPEVAVPVDIGMVPQVMPEQISANLAVPAELAGAPTRAGPEDIRGTRLGSLASMLELPAEESRVPAAPEVEIDQLTGDRTPDYVASGSAWDIARMYGHPEPPEQEPPDPECTDYLSLAIVMIIFQGPKAMLDFFQNPSLETFMEMFMILTNPIYYIYKIVDALLNFSWDTMQEFGELANSTFGKIFMFIISIVLTIVSFGSAAPILLAIIILIELIQTFVPLPKWADVLLSVVKAALGGWASAIKDMAKELIKEGIKLVITTITDLLKTLTTATLKAILKAVLRESIIQILNEILPEDLLFYMPLIGIVADWLAAGLTEMIMGDNGKGFFSGAWESMKESFGVAKGFGLVQFMTSTAMRAGLAFLVQSLFVNSKEENGYKAAQDRRAGAIWGAVASGLVGWLGAVNQVLNDNTLRDLTTPMDQIGIFLMNFVRPVVAKTVSTVVMQYAPSETKGGKEWGDMQKYFVANTWGSFAERMIPGFSTESGQWTWLPSEFTAAVGGDGATAPGGKAPTTVGSLAEAKGVLGAAAAQFGFLDGVTAAEKLGPASSQSKVESAARGEALAALATDQSQPVNEDSEITQAEAPITDPDPSLDAGQTSVQNPTQQNQQQQNQEQRRTASGIASKTEEPKNESPTRSDQETKQDNEQPVPQPEKKPDNLTLPDQVPDVQNEPLVQPDNTRENLSSPSLDNQSRENEMEVPENPEEKSVKDLKLPGTTISQEGLRKGGTQIEEQRRDDEVKVEGKDVTDGGGQGEGGEGGAGDGGSSVYQGATGLNVAQHRQQLESMAQTGQLPAKYTPADGSTVRGATVKSDMIPSESALGQVVETLTSEGSLPAEGQYELKIETFKNQDGHDVMAVSQVINAETGQTQLLALTETIGKEHITTTFQDASGSGATAKVYAGDEKGDKLMEGPDIAIPDLDVSKGFGELSKASGLSSKERAVESGERLMEGDQLDENGQPVPGSGNRQDKDKTVAAGAVDNGNGQGGDPFAGQDATLYKGENGGLEVKGSMAALKQVMDANGQVDLSKMSARPNADGTMTYEAPGLQITATPAALSEAMAGGNNLDVSRLQAVKGEQLPTTLTNNEGLSIRGSPQALEKLSDANGKLDLSKFTPQTTKDGTVKLQGPEGVEISGTPEALAKASGNQNQLDLGSFRQGSTDQQAGKNTVTEPPKQTEAPPSEYSDNQVGDGTSLISPNQEVDPSQREVAKEGDENQQRSLTPDQPKEAASGQVEVPRQHNLFQTILAEIFSLGAYEPGADIPKVSTVLTKIATLGAFEPGKAMATTYSIEVDGKTVTMQFIPETDALDRTVTSMDVKGSDGKTYQVTLSRDGLVTGAMQYVQVGNFWNSIIALRPVGGNEAYVFNRLGEVAGVYTKDAGGSWTLTQERRYTKDSDGRIISALLDVKVTADMNRDDIKLLVQAMNSDPAVLAQNRSYQDYLKGMDLTPGTAAYDNKLKELALGIGLTAIQQAYVNVIASQGETGTKLEVAYRTLATAELNVFNLDQSQVNLDTMVSHARLSQDAPVMLRAADFQLALGDRTGGLQTLNLSMDALAKLPNGPVKMETALRVLEILQTSGTPSETLTAKAIALSYASLSTVSTANLALLVRLNAVEQGMIDGAAVNRVSDELTTQINDNLGKLRAGQTIFLEGVGAVSRGMDGRVTVQQKEGNTSVTLSFKPADENRPDGPVTMDQLAVSDDQGLLSTFTREDGFARFQQRVTVQMTIGGQTGIRSVMVQKDQISADNQAVAFHQEKGVLYKVDLDLNTRGLKQEVLFSRPGDPSAQFALPVATLVIQQGQAFIMQDGVMVAAELLPSVKLENLTGLGMNPQAAKIIADLLAGKSAFVAPDGTVFVGTESDFQNGNYSVIGKNQFQAGGETLAYFAQYQDGALRRVDLSDGRIITFLDNKAQNYTLTQYHDQGQRISVSLYQDGKLAGTKLILKDMGGAELLYDNQGNLKPESLRALQEGKFPNVTFKLLPGQGFSLTDKQSGKEERFSMNGRVLMPSDTDDRASAAPNQEQSAGLVESLDFEVVRELNLKIAAYDKPAGIEVKLQSSERWNVLVRSTDGEISRTITRSNVFGELTALGTVENYVQDKATGQMSWQVRQVMGTEKMLQASAYKLGDTQLSTAKNELFFLKNSAGEAIWVVGVSPDQKDMTVMAKLQTRSGGDSGARGFVDKEGQLSFVGTEAQMSLTHHALEGNLVSAANREFYLEKNKQGEALYQGAVRDDQVILQGNLLTVNNGDSGAKGFLSVVNGKEQLSFLGTEQQLAQTKYKLAEAQVRRAQGELYLEKNDQQEPLYQGGVFNGKVVLQGHLLATDGSNSGARGFIDAGGQLSVAGTATQLAKTKYAMSESQESMARKNLVLGSENNEAVFEGGVQEGRLILQGGLKAKDGSDSGARGFVDRNGQLSVVGTAAQLAKTNYPLTKEQKQTAVANLVLTAQNGQVLYQGTVIDGSLIVQGGLQAKDGSDSGARGFVNSKGELSVAGTFAQLSRTNYPVTEAQRRVADRNFIQDEFDGQTLYQGSVVGNTLILQGNLAATDGTDSGARGSVDNSGMLSVAGTAEQLARTRYKLSTAQKGMADANLVFMREESGKAIYQGMAVNGHLVLQGGVRAENGTDSGARGMVDFSGQMSVTGTEAQLALTKYKLSLEQKVAAEQNLVLVKSGADIYYQGAVVEGHLLLQGGLRARDGSDSEARGFVDYSGQLSLVGTAAQLALTHYALSAEQQKSAEANLFFERENGAALFQGVVAEGHLIIQGGLLAKDGTNSGARGFVDSKGQLSFVGTYAQLSLTPYALTVDQRNTANATLVFKTDEQGAILYQGSVFNGQSIIYGGLKAKDGTDSGARGMVDAAGQLSVSGTFDQLAKTNFAVTLDQRAAADANLLLERDESRRPIYQGAVVKGQVILQGALKASNGTDSGAKGMITRDGQLSVRGTAEQLAKTSYGLTAAQKDLANAALLLEVENGQKMYQGAVINGKLIVQGALKAKDGTDSGARGMVTADGLLSVSGTFAQLAKTPYGLTEKQRTAATADLIFEKEGGESLYQGVVVQGKLIVQGGLKARDGSNSGARGMVDSEGQLSVIGTAAQLNQTNYRLDARQKATADANLALERENGQPLYQAAVINGKLLVQAGLKGKDGKDSGARGIVDSDGQLSVMGTAEQLAKTIYALKEKQRQVADAELIFGTDKRATVYQGVVANGQLILQGALKGLDGKDSGARGMVDAEGNLTVIGTATQLAKTKYALTAEQMQLANRYFVLEKQGKESLYTAVVTENGLMLQGRTFNGAQGFIMKGKDGKLTFGATGTVKQLDELGLKASYLMAKNQGLPQDKRVQLSAEGIVTIVSSDRTYTLQGKNAAGLAVSLSRGETGEYTYAETRSFTYQGKETQVVVSTGLTHTGELKGDNVVVIGESQVQMGKNLTLVMVDGKLVMEDARGVKEIYSLGGERLTGRWQQVKNSWHKFTDNVVQSWNSFLTTTKDLFNALAVDWSVWGAIKALGGAVGAVVLAAWAVIQTVVYAAEFILTAAWTAVEFTFVWTVNIVYWYVSIPTYMLSDKSLGEMALSGFKKTIEVIFWPIDQVLKYATMGLLWVAEQYTQMAEDYFSLGNTFGNIMGGLATAYAVLFKTLGDNLAIVVLVALTAINPAFAVLGMVLLAKDAIINGLGNMFRTFFIEPFVKIGEGMSQLWNMRSLDADVSRTRVVVQAAAMIAGGIIGVVFAFQMLKGMLDKARTFFEDMAFKKVNDYVRNHSSVRQLAKESVGEVFEKALGKEPGYAARTFGSEIANMKFGDLAFRNHRGTINSMLREAGGANKVSNLLQSKNFRLGDLTIRGSGPLTQTITPKQMISNAGIRAGLFAVAFLRAFAMQQVDMFRHSGKALFDLARGRIEYTTKAGVQKTMDIRNTRVFQATSEFVKGTWANVKATFTGTSPAGVMAPPVAGMPALEGAYRVGVGETAISRPETTQRASTESLQAPKSEMPSQTRQGVQPGVETRTVARNEAAVRTLQDRVSQAEAKLQQAITNPQASKGTVSALKGEVTKAQQALAQNLGLTLSQVRIELATQKLNAASTASARNLARAEVSRLTAEAKVETSRGQAADTRSEISKVKQEIGTIKDLGKTAEATEQLKALESKLGNLQEQLRGLQSESLVARTEVQAATLEGKLAEAASELSNGDLSKAKTAELKARTERLKEQLKQTDARKEVAQAQREIAQLDARIDKLSGDTEIRNALSEKAGVQRRIMAAEENYQKSQARIEKAQGKENQAQIKDLLQNMDKQQGQKAGSLEKALDQAIKEMSSKATTQQLLKQALTDILANRATPESIREFFKGEAGMKQLQTLAKNGLQQQAQDIFNKLADHNGATVDPATRNALAERLGLKEGQPGATEAPRVLRGELETALQDIFQMQSDGGLGKLLTGEQARNVNTGMQRTLQGIAGLEGRTSEQFAQGLERLLSNRFDRALREAGLDKTQRAETFKEAASKLDMKQLQQLLTSDSPAQALLEMRRAQSGRSAAEVQGGQPVAEAKGKALCEQFSAEGIKAAGEAGTPNFKAMLQRLEQVANAKGSYREAVARLNESVTLKEQRQAQAAVDKASAQLTRAQRMAELSPEVRGPVAELRTRLEARGGVRGAVMNWSAETIQLKKAVRESSGQVDLGVGLEIRDIMKLRDQVQQKVMDKTGIDAKIATAEINQLVQMRESVIKMRTIEAKLSEQQASHPKQVSRQTMTEARQNLRGAEEAYQAKLEKLKLGSGDVASLEQYAKGLEAADLTSSIETTWNNHYKPLLERAAANGQLAEYQRLGQQYDAQVREALKSVTPEAIKEKGGAAFAEKLTELRRGVTPGSAADIRMVESYMHEVLKRITGYESGLRLSQKIMIAEFLQGNNVGLRAGGGKTLSFILFSGMMRLIKGSAARSELLVDDAPAIDKYLNEPFKTNLTHNDLAKAMGMELVNGNTLYLEAQKTGNFSKLINALNSESTTVVFDHTTRAHLRNAAVRNVELRQALQRTNLVGIDEVHLPATSQTNAIVGGKVTAPTKLMVETVDKLLQEFKFDAKNFEKIYEAYQEKYLKHNADFAKQKVMLGDFEVVRSSNLTNDMIKRLNTSGQKTIVITEQSVFLNSAAQKVLKGYKGGDVASALKTLFSREGTAGELNSYAVKGEYIYPVDNLGKIQTEQISNDIVGQVVAARKAGLVPYNSVRVNHTTMQTSLSAMYAGNNGAHIVGASGTIAGLDNLMRSKIGSGSTHISTSLLNLQRDVFDTGGKILTSLAEADRVVMKSVLERGRNALVFEADPVAQMQLVEKYMETMQKGMNARQQGMPVISVISASSAGYFVPKGMAAEFLKQMNEARVKSGKAEIKAAIETSETMNVKGLDYLRITEAGVQTVVEGINRPGQVCIFNEQGAIGKNYQAELTLVARGAHRLTADMFTQLLLRSGRPGGPQGTWATERYAVVDPVEVRATLDAAKNPARLNEVTSLWAKDANLQPWTESLKGIDPGRINLSDQAQLGMALKLNSEYRQSELVGNSTRFAVQDTFKDRIVIDPLKSSLQEQRFQGKIVQEILDKQLTKILNEQGSEMDLALKLQSTLDPQNINRNYVQSTFMSSLGQARSVWRGVLLDAIKPPNFFRGGFRLVLESMGNYVELMRASSVVRANPVAMENYSFADIAGKGALKYQQMFSVGLHLMESVLSQNPGGIEAAKLQNQAVAIQEAVANNRVPARADVKAFQQAWQESHRFLGEIKSYDTAAVAMAASSLGVDQATARIAMAPTYAEAVKLLQYNLAFMPSQNNAPAANGVVFASDQLPQISKPIQVAGLNPVSAFLRQVPVWSQFDARSMMTQQAVWNLRETTANFNSDTWRQTHAEQVATFVKQYGENWVQPALAATFGPDVTFLQAYDQAKSPVQKTALIWRQPAQAQSLYYQALQNVERVSAFVPELAADDAKTITYQNRTLNLGQAQNYIRENVVAAQSLATRYALTTGEGFKALQSVPGSARTPADIATQAVALKQQAGVELGLQTPLHRVGVSIGRGWQNLLQNIQKSPVLVPFFKVENGWLVPTTTSKLVLGAAVVGLMSMTGLPVWGMVLGMVAGTVLTPLMSRLTPQAAAKQGAAQPGVFRKLAMPVITLLAGVVFASPLMISGAVGSVSSEVVNHTLRARVPADERVVVNEPEAREAEITGQAVRGSRTLVDEWKARMAGSQDDTKAVAELKDLLAERQIELAAGKTAEYYGYMHMLAAVLSLVPRATESLDRVELAQSAAKPATTERAGVKVDQQAVKFLDQQFSDLLLTQTLMAARGRLFSDAQSYSLTEALRQHRLFREFGSNALTEFLRQYVVDGESLKALASQDELLRNVYQQVRDVMGREYGERDLRDLTEAAGELENTGFGMMKARAADIRRLPVEDRRLKEEEFQAIFGLSYADYLKLQKTPWQQQLLGLAAGPDRLRQTDRPLLTVRSMAQQLVGAGLSVAVVGALMLGLMSGVLPVLVGGTGLVLAVAGAATWLQARSIAFNLNPAAAVEEQIAHAAFGSSQPRMEAEARQIAQLSGTREFEQRKNFAAQYGMSYETYQKIMLPTLLTDPYFSKAVKGLRIAGTEQMVSETMRNRAIRATLEHLLTVAESDASMDQKLALTKDLAQVLGFLGFNISLTYKKYADELAVTLTPEVVPRALTQDYKLGRIIKRLEGLGIGIKLEVAPLQKQPKLKTTGSAA
jgi:hypothetical protein